MYVKISRISVEFYQYVGLKRIFDIGLLNKRRLLDKGSASKGVSRERNFAICLDNWHQTVGANRSRSNFRLKRNKEKLSSHFNELRSCVLLEGFE